MTIRDLFDAKQAAMQEPGSRGRWAEEEKKSDPEHVAAISAWVHRYRHLKRKVKRKARMRRRRKHGRWGT